MADKSIAIAFGGGGARGLSHIWIMQALDELGIRPVALSGTSIGALAAACYASGMSGKELEDYVVGLLGNSREVFSRFWQSRPKSFSDLRSMQFGWGQWAQLDPEWVAETFLPDGLPEHFESLAIPTSLVATDYFTGQEVILSQGGLHKAIAASMAIPALFKPVSHNGATLIDGGCVNPMPVDHVRDQAEIVIAIDVVGLPQRSEDGKLGAIEMVFGASQLLMQTIQSEKLRHDRADILIRPDIADFRLLDFLKAEQILKASQGAKDEVKRKLEPLM